MLRVKEIVAGPPADVLRPLHLAPVALHLSQSRDPRLHIAPASVELVEFLELPLVLHHVRARPDHTHVAEQHIEELRELVHAQPPQPAAPAVNAIILRRGLPRFVIIVHAHRAELENLENLSVFAHAVLTEEKRPRRIDALDDRNHRHERQDDCRDHRDADRDVERPFHRPVVAQSQGHGRR